MPQTDKKALTIAEEGQTNIWFDADVSKMLDKCDTYGSWDKVFNGYH
jgi:hypothetical protein